MENTKLYENINKIITIFHLFPGTSNLSYFQFSLYSYDSAEYTF